MCCHFYIYPTSSWPALFTMDSDSRWVATLPIWCGWAGTSSPQGSESDYLSYNWLWHPCDSQVPAPNGCRQAPEEPITAFAFVGKERSFCPCNSLLFPCYLSKCCPCQVIHILGMGLCMYTFHTLFLVAVIWQKFSSSLTLLPWTWTIKKRLCNFSCLF